MTKQILVFLRIYRTCWVSMLRTTLSVFLVDQEEIADNSSSVKFTQVQRDELETVLKRIATKTCNIPGEYEIASRLLDVISSNGSEEIVQSFLLCLRQAFSDFYFVTTKEKTEGYSD